MRALTAVAIGAFVFTAFSSNWTEGFQWYMGSFEAWLAAPELWPNFNPLVSLFFVLSHTTNIPAFVSTVLLGVFAFIEHRRDSKKQREVR